MGVVSLEWQRIGSQDVLVLTESGKISSQDLQTAADSIIRELEAKGTPSILLANVVNVEAFSNILGMLAPSKLLIDQPLLKAGIGVLPDARKFVVPNLLVKVAAQSLKRVKVFNTMAEAESHIANLSVNTQ
jgi:hypothetical protein